MQKIRVKFSIVVAHKDFDKTAIAYCRIYIQDFCSREPYIQIIMKPFDEDMKQVKKSLRMELLELQVDDALNSQFCYRYLYKFFT